MISVLILTKNEQQDIRGCLDSVAWSDDVHVLDSYSSDLTVELPERKGRLSRSGSSTIGLLIKTGRLQTSPFEMIGFFISMPMSA